MNRYIPVALLAMAVLASGCAHSGGNPEDNHQHEHEENSGNNTVFYTDSGFQPSEITVQQGETVTWLDRSSRPMWVASDVHPSHTQYSGTSLRQHCQNGQENAFDQCSTGERYSFTFEKTGEWGYHNHEFSGDKGTVTVN